MLFNALANQCDAIPLLCLSPHHFCLALACQSFARPLRFIELRFHELHFLCITPPICALQCPSFSLRVKTSPHHCLSKRCCAYLAFANLCQSMLCRCLSTLGRCKSMSFNAMPFSALPLLCCPNQHLRTSQPFTGSLCRSLCYPELSHCHSVPFIANPLHCKSKLCRRCFRHGYHLHHSCVHVPTRAGL